MDGELIIKWKIQSRLCSHHPNHSRLMFNSYVLMQLFFFLPSVRGLEV